MRAAATTVATTASSRVYSQDTEQFYPTNGVTVRKLMDKVMHLTEQRKRLTIFDPSAGNGDILDGFSKSYSFDRCVCYAAEINEERAYTLRGKGYKVIESDFLEYCGALRFDIVAMNPPFKNGIAHVMKAWETVVDGGELVALLPDTALSESNSTKQVLAHLIEQHGTVEKIGAAFADSIRATDVMVSIIHLKKPQRDLNVDFNAAAFEVDEADRVAFSENPLASTDLIDTLVARYKAAETALIERDGAQRKLTFYLKGISMSSHGDVDYRLASEALKTEADLRTQILLLKNAFWNEVFSKSQVAAKATSGFRGQFREYAKDQAYMEFSRTNILTMLALFFENKAEIMKGCLLEVFDTATAYHEKNKIHSKGWKTNKSYRVNKRIIVPNGVKYDDKYCYSFKANYDKGDHLRDLDKVLCWLGGKDYSSKDFISIYGAIEKHCRAVNAGEVVYDGWFESSFFRIKMHKSQTVWLDFKDLYLLDDFNHVAAEGKKWLDGGY